MASTRRYLVDPSWLHRELMHNLDLFGAADCRLLQQVARILHLHRARIVRQRQLAPRSTLTYENLTDLPVLMMIAAGLEDLYVAVSQPQADIFEAAAKVVLAHPEVVEFVEREEREEMLSASTG